MRLKSITINIQIGDFMYLSNPNLRKSIRQKYRTIALCISFVFHVVMVAVFVLFFLNQEETEVDKIQAEILPELSRQIVNEQETLNPILAKRNEVIPVPQRREVAIAKPNQSKEIAKLPAPATPSADQGQVSASANFDPQFDTPNLSTDTRLKPNDRSIMSPELPSGLIGWTVSKNRNTKSKGNSEKNTGKGVSKTGTGKKNGSSIGDSDGNKDGSGTGQGSGGTGYGEGNASLNSIEKLTNDIIANSRGNTVDVVFVFVMSNSMLDNIRSVVEFLTDVGNTYKTSKIDYMFGKTDFHNKRLPRKGIQNTRRIFLLTRNLSLIKESLNSIRNKGTEYASDLGILDAIHYTVTEMNFRSDSVKHLFLLTDKKKFTSINRHTLDSVIKLCQKNKVSVNVFGRNFPDPKHIAKETGGIWHKIPMNLIK